MADEEYEAEDAGADYDDIAEDDDNIEETEEQEEEGYNVQCLAPGQAGGGVEKSKRITTRYMTKYERARVLGKVILFAIYVCFVFYARLDLPIPPHIDLLTPTPTISLSYYHYNKGLELKNLVLGSCECVLY